MSMAAEAPAAGRVHDGLHEQQLAAGAVRIVREIGLDPQVKVLEAGSG